MPRPRAFDMDTVLTRSADTYWENGYEHTAIEDIEAATGLKRGSLYNAFGSKHGLYLAALQHYCRTEMYAAVEAFNSGHNLEQGVAALFQRAVTMSGPEHSSTRGCFLCDAAIERAPHDPEVAELVQTGVNKLRNAVRERIENEWKLSDLGEGQRISDHLVASYMGLKMFVRAGYPVQTIRDIATQAAAGFAQP